MSEADHDFLRRNGRERRGVFDGNDRTARIARWLAQNSNLTADVPELVLQCSPGGDAEPEIVMRWERSIVLPEMAPDINRLIQDYADDRRTTTSALLYWARADGSPYLSKGFRATCADTEKENVFPLDGSTQSIIQMLSRHCESSAQQMALMSQRQMDNIARGDERMERMLGILERTNERLLEQITSAEDTAAAATQERDKAVELAGEAAEQAERAVKVAEEKGEQDELAKVIEIGFKQLMSGGKS